MNIAEIITRMYATETINRLYETDDFGLPSVKDIVKQIDYPCFNDDSGFIESITDFYIRKAWELGYCNAIENIKSLFREQIGSDGIEYSKPRLVYSRE